jgi:hypothetical protein
MGSGWYWLADQPRSEGVQESISRQDVLVSPLLGLPMFWCVLPHVGFVFVLSTNSDVNGSSTNQSVDRQTKGNIRCRLVDGR